MPAVVLGINHNSPDSAAALLVDGVPVAVAEEERFIPLVLSRGGNAYVPAITRLPLRDCTSGLLIYRKV